MTGRSLRILLLLACCGQATAAELTLVAIGQGRAIITLADGKNRVLRVGEDAGTDIRLLRIEEESVVLAVPGGQRRLHLGQALHLNPPAEAGMADDDPTLHAGTPDAAGASPPVPAATPAPAPEPDQVILHGDGRGHFHADALVNGSPVRFLVDTGATTVTLPRSLATRLGLDHHGGQPVGVRTAGGDVLGHRVRINELRVGDITLHQVETTILDSPGFDTPLLGMSFLNRMDMERSGSVLKLRQRF